MSNIPAGFVLNPSPRGSTHVLVTVGKEIQFTTMDKAMAVADELCLKVPGNDPIIPKFEYCSHVVDVAVAKPDAKSLRNDSSVKAGEVDTKSKARIEKMHEVLKKSGVDVDVEKQAFATGTKMLEQGYQAMQARADAHNTDMSAKEAIAKLASVVTMEQRHDIEFTSRELANKLSVNGKVTIAGYSITEQAIRGLMLRIKSPALSYLLGIRNRMAESRNMMDGAAAGSGQESMLNSSIMADRAQLAEVLRHELMNGENAELKLRVRESASNHDCFAIVSPGYTPADAPEVLDLISSKLPADAKASFSYDPTSTQWELRANVWTPTPVAEQAVGEPFEGYVSFKSRDNGTSRLNGGGGITLIRCWNASTYVAEGVEVKRVHKGNIMVDIAGMVRVARTSIDALCKAWGTARNEELVEAPTVEGVQLAREIALAGYFRGMLTSRKSELQGVLPGRTETHVERMVQTYDSERRDTTRLVKADLAQSLTRYAHEFSSPIQRDVEGAVGTWLSDSRVVECITK